MCPSIGGFKGSLLFDFELRHVPAEKHKGSDALSQKEPTEEDILEALEHDNWKDNILYILYQNLSLNSEVMSMPFYIQKDSNQERTLHEIYDFLRTLTMPELLDEKSRRRFLKKATQYFVKADAMFKRQTNKSPLLIVFKHKK